MGEPLLPPGFRWGVATSAYQIEGAWNVDGKGPSVWDTLAHRPGGFAGGATGDVACDHYHRLDEDLDLLSGLGVTGYRFSVSWPRVCPTGRGGWNERGLAFYDRLVDGLLARGIEPALTLYHWDHPQALEDAGGWMNRDMAGWFADYAAYLARRLGDRVGRWITLNEPLSVTLANMAGYGRPAGPLGRAGLSVAHHLLLAHGVAAARLREIGVSGEIGIAINLAGTEAASDVAADVAAADRAEAYEDRLFLDPLLRGRYPLVGERPLLDVDPDDLAVIASPIDFLGVNWYAPACVADAAGNAALFGYTRTDFPAAPRNMLGWPVLPERFGDLLAWLRERYPNLPPVYVTENGLPLPDCVTAPAAVADPARVDYLRRCLHQVRSAIATGLDIRGYYVWSLLDNLEWAFGFGPRFGLVHVDFDTLARTPKDSYHWYRELIAAQPARRCAWPG